MRHVHHEEVRAPGRLLVALALAEVGRFGTSTPELLSAQAARSAAIKGANESPVTDVSTRSRA
jgi:hypothetical protein